MAADEGDGMRRLAVVALLAATGCKGCWSAVQVNTHADFGQSNVYSVHCNGQLPKRCAAVFQTAAAQATQDAASCMATEVSP